MASSVSAREDALIDRAHSVRNRIAEGESMFSLPELAVILAVVAVVFGPGKLPDIGKSLGKGIRNFKKATDEESPVPQVPSKTAPAELEAAERIEQRPASTE